MFLRSIHCNLLLLTISLTVSSQGWSSGFPDEPKPVQSIEFGAPLGAVPVLYPDSRTPDSLAAVLKDGRVVKVNAAGAVQWELRIGETIDQPPAVGIFDREGSPSLVAVADSVEVIALSGEGDEQWRFALPGKTGSSLPGKTGSWSGPTCADLDGDGLDEVLIGNNFGWLICLSAEGTLLWRRHADNFRAGPTAVGDVDGDGLPEVVYGTENHRVLCVEGDGELKWLHRTEGKFGRTHIALADLDGDGCPEAAWSSSFNTPESLVHVVHAKDGSPFWKAQTILHGYGSISVGDVDSDGNPNLVYADRANTVYAYTGAGEEIWRTTTGGRGYMFPQNLGDVDGDGVVDVLAVVRNSNERGNNFFILNGKTGEIQAEYAHNGRGSISPPIADLDGDGQVEVLAVLADKGRVDFYRFGAGAGAALPWPVDRADSGRTGAAIGGLHVETAKASNRSAPVLKVQFPQSAPPGTNLLRIEPLEELPDRAFLDVSITAPNEIRTFRIDSIDRENLTESIPVDFVQPGAHRVRVGLWDESQVPANLLAEVELEIDIKGYETLEAEIGKSLDDIEGRIAGLAENRAQTSRLLHREAAAVRGDARALSVRSKSADPSNPVEADNLLFETDSVRGAVERINALLGLATRGSAGSIALWEDPNPWDLTDSLFEAPESLSATLEMKVWMVGGEVEYRAIAVCNLLPRPLDVQFRLPMGSPLALRETLEVPRDDGVWTPDALPFINQSRTLHLGPGEVRQLWVDVSSRNLAPGAHTAPIEVWPLGEEEDQTRIVFTVDVEPIHLVDAPEFAICNWTNPKDIRGLTDEDWFASYVFKQGMNVATLHGVSRRCDEAGELVGKADWSDLDEQLRDLDPRRSFLLIHGPSVSAPAGVEVGSEVWKKGLGKAMRELASHLAARGYGLDRWAYYPVDEPGLFGGTAIERLRQIAEPAKEAAPEIQIYTNPAGGVTRENFADLLNEIDVWQPELAMLRRNADLIEFFHETEDVLWSYEAPGEAKRLLPLGYYRAQPLTAVWMGLTGAGHWHFGYLRGGNDLWATTDDSEYGDHYLDGSRIVQSRRWLAFMDGAEDARLLLLLKEKIAEVHRRGIETKAVGEAEELLGPRLRNLLRKQWEHDDIARHLIDYEMSYDGVKELRREAARLIGKLTEALAAGPDGPNP